LAVCLRLLLARLTVRCNELLLLLVWLQHVHLWRQLLCLHWPLMVVVVKLLCHLLMHDIITAVCHWVCVVLRSGSVLDELLANEGKLPS